MRRPRRPSRRAMVSASFEPFDTHAARELPGVSRTVDTHVLCARRDPERVELGGGSIINEDGAMDGHVQLVPAFHEIQAVDDEADLRFTKKLSGWAAVD